MGGSLGSLNMAIYSFILMFSIILILLMVHRFFSKPEAKTGLWLGGIVALSLAGWIYTGGKHSMSAFVQGTQVTSWNPYYIALFALIIALYSSGTVAALDKKGKVAPYYTILAVVLAILTGYTGTYAGVLEEFWMPKLFMILAVVAALVLVLGPIYGIITKKMDIHALWGAIGWGVMFTAAYLINGRFAPINEVAANKAKLDPAAIDAFNTALANHQTILFAVLLVAFLFLFLEQVLTNWKLGEKE